MSVDERRRLELAEAAKRALGDDAGITLMELLPPVGWADVATKHDLAQLEERLLGRMGGRFGVVDSRFGLVDARFDVIDARFDALEAGLRADLKAVELRLDARLERGFRQMMVTMSSLLVAAFSATSAIALFR
jgi:hypothetical protein